MEAARDRLSGCVVRLDVCPACEHDGRAVDRALDTLLEGLIDNSVQARYRELGGLCLPHLRTASAQAGHRTIAWLTQTVTATVTGRSASLGWLAGTDHDADRRAVLRHAAMAIERPGSDACLACLAAARSENDHLAQFLRTSERGERDGTLLCAVHLADLIACAGQREAAALLAWQAGCLATGLARRARSSLLLRLGGGPASWLRPRHRDGGADGCPVCLTRENSMRRVVDDLRAPMRASRPITDRQVALCARHLLGLKAVDPWAGHVTAPGAVERAQTLIAELNGAFGKNTWARRHEARGAEMTAWRRAAAFLDGGVFFACPPGGT
jgi:hypothetical protein